MRDVDATRSEPAAKSNSEESENGVRNDVVYHVKIHGEMYKAPIRSTPADFSQAISIDTSHNGSDVV